MVTSLPMSDDQIVRAAEAMIAEHGSEALANAIRSADALRSQGFDSVAATWELICEVIRDLQEADLKSADYKTALGKSVFLSE